MTDKKETRGGMRWNSKNLYKSLKKKNYTCHWCGDSFASTITKHSRKERYCKSHHRIRMFLLRKSIDEKTRVTKKDRKRNSFRPEVWRA